MGTQSKVEIKNNSSRPLTFRKEIGSLVDVVANVLIERDVDGCVFCGVKVKRAV